MSVRIVDNIETNVTDRTVRQVAGFMEMERCARSCATLCLSVRIVDDIETNVTDRTAGQVTGFTEMEHCVRSCVPYAVSRADRSRKALVAGHDAGSALSQVKRWLV